MNPITDQLRNFHDLAPSTAVPGWLNYESVTPAFRFTYFVKASKDGTKLIQVAVRGSFLLEDASNICAAIDEFEDVIISLDSPKKLHPVLLGTSKFDSLIVLPPGYHNSFLAQDRSLAQQTFVVFPAYNCEFCRTESRDAIEVMRRGIVKTLDWKRDPSPRVAMRYSNPKTGGGSVGSDRGLTEISVALREASNLVGSPGAYMEIENFKNEVMEISNDGMKVTALCRNESICVASADELLQLVSGFLQGNI